MSTGNIPRDRKVPPRECIGYHLHLLRVVSNWEREREREREREMCGNAPHEGPHECRVEKLGPRAHPTPLFFGCFGQNACIVQIISVFIWPDNKKHSLNANRLSDIVETSTCKWALYSCLPLNKWKAWWNGENASNVIVIGFVRGMYCGVLSLKLTLLCILKLVSFHIWQSTSMYPWTLYQNRWFLSCFSIVLFTYVVLCLLGYVLLFHLCIFFSSFYCELKRIWNRPQSVSKQNEDNKQNRN